MYDSVSGIRLYIGQYLNIYLTVFNDNAFFSCMFLRHYGRIQTDPIFSTFIHFARKAEIIDFIYLRI